MKRVAKKQKGRGEGAGVSDNHDAQHFMTYLSRTLPLTGGHDSNFNK